MNNTEINFTNIRTHNGSQHASFEELCCQLARLENFSNDWKFTRKGGASDGGVECYWENASEEYVWQAKYLFEIDKIIKQSTVSIKKALETHPKIVKYYICFPVDIADSRQKGHKTEKVRWNEAVQEWKKLANEKNKTVEFIHWGKSELTDKLSRIEPEYSGKRHYWFNANILRLDQLAKNCENAIRDVGNRYLPDLHVLIPEIPQIFDGLVNDKQFFSEINKKENEIARLIPYLKLDEESSKKHVELSQVIQQCRSSCIQLKQSIENITRDISKRLSFLTVIKNCDELVKNIQEAEEKIAISECRNKHEKNEIFDRIKHYLFEVDHLTKEIKDYWVVGIEARCARRGILVIKGDAGAGKTHVISEIVENRIKNNLPTIFMLGQHFNAPTNPWKQIIDYLGISHGREKFLYMLDSLAEALDQKVLIAIDALNEGMGKELWPSFISGFMHALQDFPRISLVLSVRTDYFKKIFPQDLQENLLCYEHNGFEGMENKAVRHFFPKFGIKTPGTPLLAPEFSNPLFLYLLCDSLKKKGYQEIPTGLQGITKIFDFYIQALNETIVKKKDLDPKDNYVRKAITALTEVMRETMTPWLTRDKAKETLSKLDTPNVGFSDTLFNCLLSEGMLVESPLYNENEDDGERIAFTYERLSDHLIMDTVLNDLYKHTNSTSNKESKELIKNDSTIKKILDENSYNYVGWIEALCIQIPEKFSCEYFDIFSDDTYIRNENLTPFLNSLIWRDKNCYTSKTVNYLKKLPYTHPEIMELFLTVAPIPDHPLNAEKLHHLFLNKSMPLRDITCGYALTQLYLYDRLIPSLIAVCSGKNVENLDDESVRLCGIIFCWMFSSPNKALRNKATKALVNLLKNCVNILIDIMKLFESVDDLYLRERIYAVAYGVALLGIEKNALKNLSIYIYNTTFADNKPPLNVLLRDYAKGVIKLAQKQEILDAIIDMNKVLPPYNSQWPIDFPSKEEIEQIFENEKENLWFSTMLAIKSNLNSGKFGKYKYEFDEDSGCYWYNISINENCEITQEENLEKFSVSKIKCWILKRTFDLGWNIEQFGSIDFRGDYPTSNEPISTKYTWIAIKEMHCYLNDHLKFKLWSLSDSDAKNISYHGPWQTGERDIDPSFLVEKNYHFNRENFKKCWWQPHQIEFDNIPIQEKLQWIKDKKKDFPQLSNLLEIKNPNDSIEYLVLKGYYEWEEREQLNAEGQNLPVRRISCVLKSYFIKNDNLTLMKDKIEAFWKKNENTFWMPDYTGIDLGQVFIGEFPWAESCGKDSIDEQIDYEIDDEKISLISTACNYNSVFQNDTIEAIENAIKIIIPTPWLIKEMNLQWSYYSFNYSDANKTVVTISPNVSEEGPPALLISKEKIVKFLKENNVSLLWGIHLEKILTGQQNSLSELGAYYYFAGEKIEGNSIFKLRDEKGNYCCK